MSSLLGKKCIITGASRGIGLAIAQRFAEEGAICVLVGRNKTTLEKAMLSLDSGKQSNDDHVHIIRPGDVASRAFWESTSKEVGNVDFLINAAGITHYSLLITSKPEMLEQIVQTNLMGTVWSCQLLVKNMMRRKQGCIINVSSLLGAKGGRGSTVYAASKAGVIGLTRSLAAEMGPSGIRVNALLPGYIETQMTQVMTPELKSQATNEIPLRRFGYVEEVAHAALFLAQNQYANNCVLNLDGGLSAT